MHYNLTYVHNTYENYNFFAHLNSNPINRLIHNTIKQFTRHDTSTTRHVNDTTRLHRNLGDVFYSEEEVEQFVGVHPPPGCGVTPSRPPRHPTQQPHGAGEAHHREHLEQPLHGVAENTLRVSMLGRCWLRIC